MRNTSCSKVPIVIIGLSLIPAGLLLPVYNMPEYPGGARLVPISPFLSYPRPLIGPFLEPYPVVHSAYMKHLSDASVPILIISLMLIIGLLMEALIQNSYKASGSGSKSVLESSDLGYEFKKTALVRLPLLLLLSAGIVLGELLLDASWAASAPFSVLGRLVPGLAILGSPLLLFPLGLLFAICEGLRFIRLRCIIFLLTGFAVFLLLGPGFAGVSGLKYETAGRNGSVELSPSGYIYQKLGSWVALKENESRDFDALKRLKKGADFEWSASASQLEEEAANAIDGDVHTRWRTGGAQKGGESLTLNFDRSVRVIRVVLSTRGTPADFPRGILVQGGNSEDSLAELFKQEDWLGPLKWTKEKYPYFGPQSEVVIDFAEEEEVSVIKFTQISSDPRFDWSVSEVKLYSKTQ